MNDRYSNSWQLTPAMIIKLVSSQLDEPGSSVKNTSKLGLPIIIAFPAIG
jgi:hypothetical protein